MLCFVGALLALSPYPKLGLALNVPEGGGQDAYLVAMRQQVRLGLDGGTISVKWDEIAQSGTKPLSDGIGGATFMGQKVLLTIATIDTVKRRLPPSLMGAGWDDPGLQRQFDGLLEGLSPIVKGHISWLSLGNEVNPYLTAHPQEQAPYLRFLAHSRGTVHRLLPGVGVGVTATCTDAMQDPALAKRLQQGMDATVFTYYTLQGLNPGGSLRTEGDFSFMEQVAGARPLLLQEIGCPASPRAGSSEEIQARFVQEVFEQLDRNASTVQLAVFFMQCDFSKSAVAVLTGYYGLDQAPFAAFLGSLGLRDATGKPRKAWDVFAAACMKRKPIE